MTDPYTTLAAVNDPAVGGNLVDVHDSPSSSKLFGPNWLNIDATDFIRFRPGRSVDSGDIWVTLGTVTRNAHGKSDLTKSTCSDPTLPSAITQSDAFPEYKGVYSTKDTPSD
jgi:hypothetical protein